MVNNVGSTDKLIRLILGAMLIAYGIYKGMLALPIIIGAVLVVTALINFCPLYRIINFSTNK